MDISEEMIRTLDIKTPSMFKETGMLSGGNQQKVIIGKWLHKGFDILILDEPTKGIDVNAKFEIYKLLHDLTKQEMCIRDSTNTGSRRAVSKRLPAWRLFTGSVSI